MTKTLASRELRIASRQVLYLAAAASNLSPNYILSFGVHHCHINIWNLDSIPNPNPNINFNPTLHISIIANSGHYAWRIAITESDINAAA